jgi:hypothetical protein
VSHVPAALTGVHRTPAHVAGYRLAVPADSRRALAAGWLFLGVAALVASGLFSVLLVLSRTPGLQVVFRRADFFRVALVAHVDLSVLVWFVAFAGMLWALAGTRQAVRLAWSGLALCAAGTLSIGLAPFVERARPIMANYIPVLDGPVFLGGLVLLGAGAGVALLRALFATQTTLQELDAPAAIRLGLLAAAACTAVALFAFGSSWLALPRGLDARAYYEVLFWGGGHVLQFTWTLLMLVSWLWLADAIGARLPLSPRVVLLLFGLALLLALFTPVVYLAYEVTSLEHRRALTWMMRVGGGLAILPLALALLWALAVAHPPAQRVRPLRAALLMSLLLFAAGGAIGFAIDGSNVKVPAHYHGCIVGVTLAFMGVAYELLPRLGFRAPPPRPALWQPVIYGVGQLMHIAGLMWSGGYGVQRKVAGAEQVLSGLQEVAGMALMGLGGLIAVAGGALFLWLVAQSVWPPRRLGGHALA